MQGLPELCASQGIISRRADSNDSSLFENLGEQREKTFYLTKMAGFKKLRLIRMNSSELTSGSFSLLNEYKNKALKRGSEWY